jgi:hypothetical protein
MRRVVIVVLLNPLQELEIILKLHLHEPTNINDLVNPLLGESVLQDLVVWDRLVLQLSVKIHLLHWDQARVELVEDLAIKSRRSALLDLLVV